MGTSVEVVLRSSILDVVGTTNSPVNSVLLIIVSIEERSRRDARRAADIASVGIVNQSKIVTIVI